VIVIVSSSASRGAPGLVFNPQLVEAVVNLDRLFHYTLVCSWEIYYFLAYLILKPVVEDFRERIFVFLAEVFYNLLELGVVRCR
jgi:hypothetical protein